MELPAEPVAWGTFRKDGRLIEFFEEPHKAAQYIHGDEYVAPLYAEHKYALGPMRAPIDERAARIEAALRELLEVKDLDERAGAIAFAGPLSEFGDEWGAEHHRLRKDYLRRQPIAWDAARAALKP